MSNAVVDSSFVAKRIRKAADVPPWATAGLRVGGRGASPCGDNTSVRQTASRQARLAGECRRKVPPEAVYPCRRADGVLRRRVYFSSAGSGGPGFGGGAGSSPGGWNVSIGSGGVKRVFGGSRTTSRSNGHATSSRLLTIS